MAGYFTREHFALLNQWMGKMRDKSNPEQNQAYEALKNAYEVTEDWARQLQAAFFPNGHVELRKRPTTQRDTFASYNWAKIYPFPDAPKELAYTVGIDAKDGFVVKIDTVGFGDGTVVRRNYCQLRGDDGNHSPIVAMLPVEEGLIMTLSQLLAWSVQSIEGFQFSYDELVGKLALGVKLGDDALLAHFDSKPAFKAFRATWTAQEKERFCRLARAVHAAGFDWWHAGKGIQVRFGRKGPDDVRAVGVLGVVRGEQTRKISWMRAVGGVPALHRIPLTDDWVGKMEATLSAERSMVGSWWALETERPGLWPDQLKCEPETQGEEPDSEDLPKATATVPSFNRIYYGPPGTGKTYEVTKLLQRDYEQAMATVSGEEWKAQQIGAEIADLTWWQVVAAALYEMGKPARVGDILAHPFVQAVALAKGRKKNVRETLWGTLQHHTISDSKTVNTKTRSEPAIFDKGEDTTWFLTGDWEEVCVELVAKVKAYQAGPPVSGQIKHYSFVTFHQSYGYEEFVEGLRPVLAGEEESSDIQYAIRPGVFKKLCEQARRAPNHRFAMVIDEINRGNISKIFGELITLIEIDKREGAENAVSVTLPYSGDLFAVPANVDIIGTMNTADRSLALLDTALRRRFDFVPVMPDARDDAEAPLAGMRVSVGTQVIDIPRMLTAMNQRVEALYDRDHCIGHAYFTSLAKVPDGEPRMEALSQIFSKRILPLLEEYFFEDWQKIRLVLADNQKPASAQFVQESQSPNDDWVSLFGHDHGLDTYTAKPRYVVQTEAFNNPEAFIGVYGSLAS